MRSNSYNIIKVNPEDVEDKVKEVYYVYVYNDYDGSIKCLVDYTNKEIAHMILDEDNTFFYFERE